MLVKCENPVEVAREAFWLAWQACRRPMGMGVFQDAPSATKDDVWKQVSGPSVDYGYSSFSGGKPQKPHADDVFGRRRKLYVEIKEDGILVRDETPRIDYQAWCGMYPTYEQLIEAAAKNVNSVPA